MRSLSIIALLVAAPAMSSLVYDFDTDGQGWGLFNDGQSFAWDGAIGSDAPGAIRARDIVSGDIWYFSAPISDLGDHSNLFGNDINYDILGIQGNQTSIPNSADIMLVGAGMSIGIDIDTVPVNGQWTSWAATVDDTSNWKHINSLSGGTLSGTSATSADILAILGDLQGFHIRGEYTNGSDQTAIDSVHFVPTPGALSLLGLGAMGITRRRR